MKAAEGIRVDEVSMAYGSSKILDGVSLSIGKGSVITMVGPNGCGKTTLLKIINNLLKPDRGRVFVEGREVNSMPAHRLARIMGYVPQGHKLAGNLTVQHGKMQVDGEIDGNVVVIDGSMNLASTAHISGQVTKVDEAFEWMWFKFNEFFSQISK